MHKTIIQIGLLLLVLGLSACSNSGMKSERIGAGPTSVSGTLAPRITAAYKAYDEGRLSTAETLLLKYTNEHPEFTDAWFKLGNIYYRTGQYPAAITAYENVLQQDNKHSKAWYNLALTRIRQAEETLVAGELKFEPGDERRLRLTSLKKKIRSGVRQYKPKKQ